MHPSSFEIIKGITCFSRFELCFQIQTVYIFCFLACKTLNNCNIIHYLLHYFFQISFSNGKFFPSQLVIFIYKGFNFCYSLWISLYFFITWHNCDSILKTFVIFFIDGIYYSFFFFIQSGESIYDPPRFWFILWNL